MIREDMARCDRLAAQIAELRVEVELLREALRCTCMVGFGQVRDPKCPTHGRRDPAHTITGPSEGFSDIWREERA